MPDKQMNLMFWKKKKEVVDRQAVERKRVDASQFNEQSATWAFVYNQLAEELEQLRKDNDNTKHGETDTAFIRGRIYQIKELQKLPEKIRAEIDHPANRPPA